MNDYHILGLPGGFSFGDHISSGRIFANKIRTHLLKDLEQFINDKKPIIGICNGFQVLVNLGLLPFSKNKISREVTLAQNNSCRFEDRWVNLTINSANSSPWLTNITEISLPIRHGEGKFIIRDEDIKKRVVSDNLYALSYANEDFKSTDKYPENPNGSFHNIAGITDPSGMIFGLMPHPEAFMIKENQPGWKYNKIALNKKGAEQLKAEDGAGMIFFYNIINHLKKS